jgi:hypothetical protein
MATTRRTSATADRRSAVATAGATAGHGAPRPRPKDRIPPHWPDDLDVPVPSLAAGVSA